MLLAYICNNLSFIISALSSFESEVMNSTWWQRRAKQFVVQVTVTSNILVPCTVHVTVCLPLTSHLRSRLPSNPFNRISFASTHLLPCAQYEIRKVSNYKQLVKTNFLYCSSVSKTVKNGIMFKNAYIFKTSWLHFLGLREVQRLQCQKKTANANSSQQEIKEVC